MKAAMRSRDMSRKSGTKKGEARLPEPLCGMLLHAFGQYFT